MDLDPEGPLAVAVTDAIRSGDVPALARLLAGNQGLATARLAADSPCEVSRTLLHVATDWPGHCPNGAATVAALVAAGADVNARCTGGHNETPLHWAASSNDVPVLDALLDAGADIEASGAVIAGGSPLADARGFGQWKAAYRLVDRGAKVTLKDAATLGLMPRLERFFMTDPLPDAGEITRGFWGACHGGQLRAAEYLLDRGADINWIGHDAMTPLDVAQHPSAEELVGENRVRALVDWLRARGARPAAAQKK
jgi:hypothetical protein